MKKSRLIITIMTIMTIAIFTLNNQEKNDSTIYVQAASSMQNALNEIETNFEQLGYNLEINYGGSGTLASQIINGAPADIFISASNDNFKTVLDNGQVLEKDTLVKNELVLIAQNTSSIDSLEDINTIAIGTVDSVPAGTYAMQVIENLGLKDKVTNKLVQAKDVSNVLTYVESGNADIGFVYNTDALSSDQVKVIYRFDDSMHDPINYPIGLLSDSEEANAFYQYMLSDDAQKILERYGFKSNE